MAYFDSAKNRALWEKEMVGLRKEKARRAEIIKNGGSIFAEEEKAEKTVEKDVTRERTSYAKLLKEEMATMDKQKKPLQKTKVMERTKEKTKGGLEL